MEDELVSFEVAKLAKEKRFNQYCNYAYYEIYKDSEIEIKFSSNETMYSSEWKYFIQESFITPTQSLLQRWLREVHGAKLYCVPSPLSSRVNNWTWMLDAYEEGVWKGRVQSDSIFDTYEQSLEKGLLETLKLIQNVGTKSQN
jgi:hypothetical protein